MSEKKRKVSFVLDIDVKYKYSLNQIYAGASWRKRQRIAAQVHYLVSHTLKELKIERELFKNPVIISLCYNSRLDIDNHGYLSKLIMDGLKGYLIKDDTRKYVRELRQSFWDDLGVLVEVWEA